MDTELPDIKATIEYLKAAHTHGSKIADAITLLRHMDQSCKWTDYDGSYDVGCCNQTFHLQNGLELYEFCPYCGHAVEPIDPQGGAK